MKTIFLSISFLFVGLCSLAQIPEPAKLLEQLKREENKAAKLEILNTLADFYLDKKPDSAFIFQTKASLLARSENNQAQMAHAANIIGLIHLRRNEFMTCLTHLKKAHKDALEANDFFEIARNKEIMGYVYSKWGSSQSAIDYYLRAIELYKEYGTPRNLATTYNALGAEYLKAQKFSLASKYLKLAAKYAAQTDDKSYMAYVLDNFGLSYSAQGKSDQAILTYKKALQIYKQTNTHNGCIKVLHNIAAEWIAAQNYPKAISYIEQSKLYSMPIDHKMRMFQLESTIADSMGNFELALKQHKHFIVIRDSLFKQAKYETFSKMQAIYETESSKKENKVLLKTIKETNESNRNQRNVIITISSLLVLVFLLLIKIYLQFKDKKVKNRKLEEQNVKIIVQNKKLTKQSSEIESQREKLSQLVEQMQELSAFKQQMNAMLVHDMKNPLNAVIGLSELEISRNEQAGNYEMILIAGKQMLMLVNNILDIERFEHVEVKLNLQNISFVEMLANVHDQIKYSLEEKRLAFETELEEGINLQIDPTLAERILINLVSNAIKFSSEGKSIRIRAYRSAAEFARIEVTDQGEGIEETNIDKIFDKFAHFSKKNSLIKSSTGLGLTFCKMATEAHGGEIGANSVYGHGATFWLTLPLAKYE